MKNRMDDFIDFAAFILTTVVMVFIGWLAFQAFGFESERPWNFILFMIMFLALDAMVGALEDKLGFFLVKNGWLTGFWQVTLCHAMLDFLGELGILLLLRHLPGIHIKAVAAYQFAFCWGLVDVAISCWGEWKSSD